MVTNNMKLALIVLSILFVALVAFVVKNEAWTSHGGHTLISPPTKEVAEMRQEYMNHLIEGNETSKQIADSIKSHRK